MHTLIDEVIAEATILCDVMQLDRALAAWEQAAIDQLLAQPTLHVDETSLRVARKNHWILVYTAGDVTLKFLHPKRGLEAIVAIGIIPPMAGLSSITAGRPTWPMRTAAMACAARIWCGN